MLSRLLFYWLKIFLFICDTCKTRKCSFGNDEAHFECVQFHLPVFVCFVCINFDFCSRVGVNCRSLNRNYLVSVRGRPFNFWGGGGGVGDFEKKYPASAYA